ncbi:MAG TPA: prolyl oligopeptidase family serine peptidase, partial [Patescibacteria group bacterium]|nr:prolyl oligopeptidase family serine peptidase [Patescibacteria group bacterium]
EAYTQLARAYARMNQNEKGLAMLDSAAEAGYSNVYMINNDSDFRNMRILKDFQRILKIFQRNYENFNEFPVRFAPQKRWGRYRVLYPNNFDEAKKYQLVVMFHGNGQDPGVMLRWAKQLNLSNEVLFVCPEAPYVKMRETIYSQQMRLSATGEDLGYSDSLRPDVIATSAEWYASVIDDAMAELPVKNNLPVIIGFSQGGFYASVVATRYPQKISSVIVICGSMYQEGRVTQRLNLLRQYGIDLLVMHGTEDEVVPYQTAVLYTNALKNEDVQHTLYPFKGGHWPTTEATRKAADWIKQHTGIR